MAVGDTVSGNWKIAFDGEATSGTQLSKTGVPGLWEDSLGQWWMMGPGTGDDSDVWCLTDPMVSNTYTSITDWEARATGDNIWQQTYMFVQTANLFIQSDHRDDQSAGGDDGFSNFGVATPATPSLTGSVSGATWASGNVSTSQPPLFSFVVQNSSADTGIGDADDYIAVIFFEDAGSDNINTLFLDSVASTLTQASSTASMSGLTADPAEGNHTIRSAWKFDKTGDHNLLSYATPFDGNKVPAMITFQTSTTNDITGFCVKWDNTNDRWIVDTTSEVTIFDASAVTPACTQATADIAYSPQEDCYYLATVDHTNNKLFMQKSTDEFGQTWGAETTLDTVTTMANTPTTSLAAVTLSATDGDLLYCTVNYSGGVDIYEYSISANTWTHLQSVSTGAFIWFDRYMTNPVGFNTSYYAMYNSTDFGSPWYITNATLTDPALTLTNTFYTDGFAHILSDPALSDSDTFYIDVLEQLLVISDPVLTNSNTMFVDVLDATRYVTDPSLVDADTLNVDALGRETNFNPYWRWRFVRQDGGLYVIPVKSAQAWAGAEVVSSDFRFGWDAVDYINAAAASAWASDSGSPAATLKAAIDTALGSFGIKDMEGNVLT